MIKDTQSILDFQVEEIDITNMHESIVNPSRITISEVGYYSISGNCGFQPNNNGFRELNIRLNGTTYLKRARELSISSSVIASVHVETVKYLNINDYIELVAYHNANTTLDSQIEVEYTQFIVRKIF